MTRWKRWLMPFTRWHVGPLEVGLKFREGDFVGLLAPGTHWEFDPLRQTRVDLVSRLDPWLAHPQFEQIVQSGHAAAELVVVDLQDHQRALVSVDRRFSGVLSPGRHAYWKGPREVHIEMVETRGTRFEHPELSRIVRVPQVASALDFRRVQPDHVGVLFLNGRYVETLPAGEYAFWKGIADIRLQELDTRETQLDVGGQEILTADKVTLRINAVVTYRVVDARQVLSRSDDIRQALYRDAQLALRGVIGLRELDQLLSDKDAVAHELDEAIRRRSAELGLEITAVGIRDLILPGEVRELMNKVTAAQKLAEANLIARREETAAIRSQANTAKLLAENPTLMRLRELEVLEKIASSGELKVLLGEKGLVDRITNML